MKTLTLIAALALMASPGLADVGAVKGDPVQGEVDFENCMECHSVVTPEGDMLKEGAEKGPNLWGVVGRKVASYPGFTYGLSLQIVGQKGLVWDEGMLLDYVSNPREWLQEQTGQESAHPNMKFKLPDGAADVVAYLATLTAPKSPGTGGRPGAAPPPPAFSPARCVCGFGQGQNRSGWRRRRNRSTSAMPQSAQVNRRLVLDHRPVGAPDATTLRLETGPVPQPGPGQMLLRTIFLSVDPYMRGRMSDAPSYAPPVAVGAVMVGGTVSEVMVSHLPGFAQGDRVLSYHGWQDYALSDGKGVQPLGRAPQNPSWALGILGMPGFTAWAGLTQIGLPKPGETLCVAAATGPVGATVGQIGKQMGLRVISVAGGPEKCAHAVQRLGFDLCLDHKAPGLAERLAEATPQGVDIYFENVGGAVLDAVLPRMNPGGRIPVCGQIALYNATALPPGPDRMPALMGQILRKRLTLRGFIIYDDFGPLYPTFAKAMQGWIAAGQMHYREEVIEGLENAPAALYGLLTGENFGKRVIRVG
jgi:NADPH-dependent curcumin reductase